MSAFRHRNYRLFFIGQAISLIGTWMQTVAQSWLVLHADPRPAVAGRGRRRPVHPGPRLRAVRRRPRRHAAQAPDAASRPRRSRWACRSILAVLAITGHAIDPAPDRPGADASGPSTPSTCPSGRRSRSRWSVARTSATRSPSTRRCSTARASSGRPSPASTIGAVGVAAAFVDRRRQLPGRDRRAAARCASPSSTRPPGSSDPSRSGRDDPAPRRSLATSGRPRSC